MGRWIFAGAVVVVCLSIAFLASYELISGSRDDPSDLLLEHESIEEAEPEPVETVVPAKETPTPQSLSLNKEALLQGPVELVLPSGRVYDESPGAAVISTPDPAVPIKVAGEGEYPGPVQRLRVQAVWLDTQEGIEGTTVTLTRVKGGLIITRGLTDRAGSVEFEFPREWTHVNLNFRNPKAMTAARGVDLPAEQPYVTRLQRGAVVFGRVLVDGRPVAGAEVQVVGKKNIWTLSGQNGEYELGSFAEGDVKLFARWKDYVSAIDEEQAPKFRIVLLGERSGPHDIKLHRGRAMSGTVRDAETGQGIPGAIIEWEQFNREKVQSDAAGNYRLGGLMGFGGEYNIGARAKGYTAMWTVAKFMGEQVLHQDFQMEKAGIIEVLVVDEHDQPLPGARILLSGRFYRNVEDRTDVNGRYVLDDVSIKNPPEIYAAKEGYKTLELSPVLFEPGTTRTDFKIRLQKEVESPLKGIVGALIGN